MVLKPGYQNVANASEKNDLGYFLLEVGYTLSNICPIFGFFTEEFAY
jgi:hypothetical protein